MGRGDRGLSGGRFHQRLGAMEMFKRLVREIHRRSLWQVVGIYLVGAWFGYQVTLGLTDGLGLPDWVPPLAFILFVIGLPIVTATAFVQEGGPTGDAFRSSARDDDDPHRALDPNSVAGPAPASSGVGSAAREDRLVHVFLTWPRALLGGVLAFAVLGAGTAGWMGMRALGVGPVASLVAAGTIEDQERILVADFAGSPDLRETARLVKDALEIDFARSTLVRVVGASEVREVLRRMDRDDEPELAGEVAREVALRAGINVYLTGEVGPVGTGFVISTRLLSAATGETLLAARETARDLDDLIPAVDRLSRHLRERTGESLRTIRREPPLEKVTTSSLPALQKFTEGRRAHTWHADQQAALDLYEQAVARDSAFASAWRAISAIRSNRGEMELALESVDRALAFQERLTEVERLGTIAFRHYLLGEGAAAIGAYERALRIAPRDPTVLNNLGVQYQRMEDLPRAEEYFRRGLEADSASILILENLATVLWSLERYDEVRDLSDRALRLDPGVVLTRVRLAAMPAAWGDYRAAEGNLRAIVDDPATSQRMRNQAVRFLVGILDARGRLEEADRVRAAAGHPRPPWLSQAYAELERRFWNALAFLERPEVARDLLGRMQTLLEEEGVRDGPAHQSVARACAALGEVGCARERLERAGLAAPPTFPFPWWHHALHGEVALAEGDHQQALHHFRVSRSPLCRNCLETSTGRVFEALGQPDSAIVAYERFLASSSPNRIRDQEWEVPLIHMRLARLYEEMGDLEVARRHHGRVIELWEDADAELQHRVVEARRALARFEAVGS